MSEISELLPPLPKPARFDYDHGADMGTPVYSEAQMRKYALDTIRRAEARQAPGDDGVSQWFDLTGDARLGECATDGCGGQPIVRLEAGGIGANYCSGCAAKIRSPQSPLPAGTVTEEMVERAARKLAGALLDHVYEGDAESEWDRLAAPVRIALEAAFAARPAAHPDDIAVDAFAAAMRAKLKWERDERHRSGWQDMSAEELSKLLYEHLPKGDPVDVANLAMMLHQNGQQIAARPAGPVAVKIKPLEWVDADEGIPDDLLDLIETAISDSMEMEWTPRLGAEHVYRDMEREGLVQRLHTTPVVLKALIDLELYLRDTPHHNSTQAAAARAAIAQAIVRSNEHQL